MQHVRVLCLKQKRAQSSQCSIDPTSLRCFLLTVVLKTHGITDPKPRLARVDHLSAVHLMLFHSKLLLVLCVRSSPVYVVSSPCDVIIPRAVSVPECHSDGSYFSSAEITLGLIQKSHILESNNLK